MSPPSSGQKYKHKYAELATCFMLASGLAYYSTLKMEAVEETTGWKRFSECCGHL
jgi:hypothetical protein